VRAGSVGSAARISVEPRGHGLAPRLSVKTGAKRSSLNIAVEARNGAVTVRGDLPADVEEWSARFAHPDPVALFGAAVVEGLGRRGIRIRGGWRRERGAGGGLVVARVRSPLSDALLPILLESDNGVADQLFFATAVEVTGAGTREAGRTATARTLESLGVPPDGLVQVDGSGLSRDDRVSARQLASLVEAVLVRGGESARLFRAALPLAGESGSLADRMRDSRARGKVHAKTGWITGTSALAGLVEPDSGRGPIVFAILVDYPDASGLNTRCWKPMQDAICEALVDWGEGDV
jgi:D-alanyl-D-alanine carboxypeptidase/D-alanyl-D-alanine-endopeptidase (penicillin-binding protein 4)